ncbi:MAG: sensor histidine kinase [Clostridiales bacterium]|nr:sensor histidine kinase [Clostridiales bacterium]
MNMDMVTIFIDIICTVWEGMIGAYLLRTYATKKIPLKIDVIWIFLFVIFVETMTFLSVSSIIKIIIECFLFPFFMLWVYKISIEKSFLSMTLLAFLAVLSELTLATVLGIWFIDVSSLGAVYTVEYALINHIFITVLAVIMKKILKKLGRNFTRREILLLSVLLFSLILLLASVANRSLFGWNLISQISQILGVILLLAALSLLIYFVHESVRIRLIQQREEQQLQKLQVQYQYYEERLKDEQRVRGIYHDMKNHLLVLQAQLKEIGNTGDKGKRQEAEEMIEKIQNQISDYEDYVQTGNAFLDVILRDKSRKAKEERIDLHTEIDFSKGNFIDALDISTIFGNALDNAIEACEKVPEEERFITMKAREKNHFLVIHIENSAVQEEEEKKTTKEDTFLHGFGLKNIQRAAEKYGGQCKRNYQSGVYMLSILIPIK